MLYLLYLFMPAGLYGVFISSADGSEDLARLAEQLLFAIHPVGALLRLRHLRLQIGERDAVLGRALDLAKFGELLRLPLVLIELLHEAVLRMRVDPYTFG